MSAAVHIETMQTCGDNKMTNGAPMKASATEPESGWSLPLASCSGLQMHSQQEQDMDIQGTIGTWNATNARTVRGQARQLEMKVLS